MVTAFLNSKIPDEYEIYCMQPQGYSDGTKRVWKLNQALYGLHKAPLWWFETLVKVMKDAGFVPMSTEMCLFKHEKLGVLVLIYVENDDGGFSVYVERQKDRLRSDDRFRGRAKRLAEIEADPECLWSEWDLEQFKQEEQRYYYRERGCQGFRDYVEAMRRRLAGHDFTQPFELDEDPKKQDRLTTWIEYLGYEY
ncbi:Uu.00g137170.m01.CDS01 [Anthostomella pinea]|uniref:Uu.00g137170.m01.CDS01 n=1 Tax=Anthostomella pinea TaxID=933095 RepID=A0AAI8VPI5_9PEZI|nr:Uu.00g137170.m01.CDS01 [Anthostomella pinea]